MFDGNVGSLNNNDPGRKLIYVHKELSSAPDNHVDCSSNQVENDLESYVTNFEDCNL